MRSRSTPRWPRSLLALVVLFSLAVYGNVSAQEKAGKADRAASLASKAGTISPVMRKDFQPGVRVSKAEYRRIGDALYSMRTEMAAQVQPAAGEAATLEAEAGETGPGGGTRFHGVPSALQVGKNIQNTVASGSTCGTGSTLAEPAAANEGNRVFYSGNLRHQEFSTNGGTSYTCAAAYPAGPIEAPIAFGDTDVVYDHSRGVTFHSVLYVNSTVTNGVIRIFVRRSMNLADNCSYTIDTDPTLTNVIDDYPHLGLSNNNLYVNANRVQFPAKTWLGAFMIRLNVDQMADCVTASTGSINFTNAGQRILVPGQGARDVMYFAWVNTTSQWRIFSWADNSGTVFSTFITVGTMTFGDPDCRGGTNNADWADALSASIVGFNVRATVGGDFVSVWVQTAADASHVQSHVHGAVMRIGASQTALTLVQQPVVFNTTACFGMPNPSVNDRGDTGMALAFGGKAGGGGSAVGTAVIMRDEFTPGPGGFSFAMIATGTHNPTRYGDYFTVRRNSPCGEWFDTTGYALSGGTGLSNVNARYAEFGRVRDAQCYFGWRNAVPAT